MICVQTEYIVNWTKWRVDTHRQTHAIKSHGQSKAKSIQSAGCFDMYWIISMVMRQAYDTQQANKLGNVNSAATVNVAVYVYAYVYDTTNINESLRDTKQRCEQYRKHNTPSYAYMWILFSLPSMRSDFKLCVPHRLQRTRHMCFRLWIWLRSSCMCVVSCIYALADNKCKHSTKNTQVLRRLSRMRSK